MIMAISSAHEQYLTLIIVCCSLPDTLTLVYEAKDKLFEIDEVSKIQSADTYM